MLTWISDSLTESESGPKDMTAVNAGVHELTGVRLPLQPYTGGHAVFMYSTAADGNVTLQLRDSEDLDRSGLAAMLARLQDDATLSISYQDTDILSDGGIDVLLGTATGTGTLQGTGATETVTATFDLFDSSSGHDLTLSPQTFTNSAEAFINDNSNSLGMPADAETGITAEDQKKSGQNSVDVVKLAVKRARPKASSPNRQGPQQCQVCAKVFGNASALAKHKLTHSDERKYVCTMCGKAFKRQDHLNGHMLTHRNKKPYECKAEGCGKSYCDARSLRRHTENHHSTSGTSSASSTTTMSPAQGAAAGDAASPHGSSCIQYAPPPSTSTATPVTASSQTVSASSTCTKSSGKSQLQQLLATDPVKNASSSNNDGLTKQQLDLIHQIMEQTQRQAQPPSKSPSRTGMKPTSSKPSTKIQRAWPSPQTSAVKTIATTTSTVSKLGIVSNSPGSTAAPSSSSGTIGGLAGMTAGGNITNNSKSEIKPVECYLCHRKFKNIPALNGHMRLHGGYFKKDAENKKCEKRENTAPPLQTASISVRALIEEKIINKRITNPAQQQHQHSTGISTSTTTTAAMTTASDINANRSQGTAPPLFPLTLRSGCESDAKVSAFVMPAPPQPSAEKARRHSDAETFTVPRAPPAQQDTDVLADIILKRGTKMSVKRTSSDPGRTPHHIQLQFQPGGDTFTLTSTEANATDSTSTRGATEYFSSASLQDDVFAQTIPEAMLLQGVDTQQLTSIQIQAAAAATLLQQEQDEQLQDIASLEDYASVTASLQETATVAQYASTGPAHGVVAQELQAVLESPLPDTLTDFSTFHAPSIDRSPLQSPQIRLDSPGFAYPTPPASHEEHSPSFATTNGTSLLPVISPPQQQTPPADFGQPGITSNANGSRNEEQADEPPQASSPLSAAFFTSTMSSAAAVEEALEEVLPGESISPDDMYTSLSNSPPPQSPASMAVTPVSSPLTASTTSSRCTTTFVPSAGATVANTFPLSPHYTLQSHMMPNSDDPLLSSSPKDFSARKRFDFGGLQTLKIVGNGYIDFGNPNLAGILVDNNGELKFIQTTCGPAQTKNIILTAPVETRTSSTNKQQRVNKMAQYLESVTSRPISAVPQRSKLHVAVDAFKQEESDDVFLSPTTIPVSPNRMSRKRPRSEPSQQSVVHQSRLRAVRGRHPGAAPFTPLPILNPSRRGVGLYWNASMRTTVAVLDDTPNDTSNTIEIVPESDSTPHINVGAQFQCSNIPPPIQYDYVKYDSDPSFEHLLWDPGISSQFTDSEVEMYLDFACCAAVPGGGRNKEYALHLLHMCGGNIHEAMLRLMQPMPTLPTDHPLLQYPYHESDQWSTTETDAFQQALEKHDKDFINIAREIGTKTVKQCVQFYYMWKKVCAEEYRRFRAKREQSGMTTGRLDADEDKTCPDSKVLGIPDTESALSGAEHRLFACEFSECSASFNSRAALNGHIRIHGGTARRSPTPTSQVERRTQSGTPTSSFSSDTTDEYPCKICGKVFSKIKSRSAHMKSHRPTDTEPKKKTGDFISSLVAVNTILSSPVNVAGTTAAAPASPISTLIAVAQPP